MVEAQRACCRDKGRASLPGTGADWRWRRLACRSARKLAAPATSRCDLSASTNTNRGRSCRRYAPLAKTMGCAHDRPRKTSVGVLERHSGTGEVAMSARLPSGNETQKGRSGRTIRRTLRRRMAAEGRVGGCRESGSRRGQQKQRRRWRFSSR